LSCTLRDEARIVHRHFVERVWRRRIIALAAAYIVALSSLVASFGAARAAAEAVAHPLGVICHGAAAGGTAFPQGQGNSGICIDCCCVGCLAPMAALPPPPVNALPPLRAVSNRLPPVAVAALAGARPAKSHRSRAPPSAA
jgi:hypothetical protein